MKPDIRKITQTQTQTRTIGTVLMHKYNDKEAEEKKQSKLGNDKLKSKFFDSDKLKSKFFDKERD